jgi:hypothetical protein
MARRGLTIDSDDYDDITSSVGSGANAAADSDMITDPTSQQPYIPLSKRPPTSQFRIIKSHILADLEASRDWRKQASEDLGFAAGHQLTDEDKQLLDDQGRPHIVFNRVETILKAIAGMEINGRHEINFLPRNNADSEKNELLTATSKWMADGCDAEDEQSGAFQTTMCTGLGFVECRYSYEDEPEGSYIEEEIDCREMVWDRTASKKNLRDSRRKARLRRMPLGDAMQLFPGKTRLQIDASWANNTLLDQGTLKSIEEKRIRDGNDSDTEDMDDRNEVTVVVFQWREKETYYRVADLSTNSIQEYTPAQHAKVQGRLKQIGARAGMTPTLHSRKATRWAYFQAFLGSDALLDTVTPAPCGKQFSWAAITGSYDKKKRMWYGLIRVMRDPQMWANKFMSQIMQIMNSTAKGGIIAEADAFDDQREAEEGYAQPEAIVWAAPGALSGGRPKIIAKPGQGDPSAFVQLLTYAVQSITAVTGINLELLGQQDQQQPGVVEHMRKQAGMTVLATLFDSLRGCLKIVGRKRLYYIQTRVPDGTMIRVAGAEYADVVQITKDKTTGTFDVVVDDAPTSPNMKEANWAVMQPMLVAFKDQLSANPELLMMALEYSPLPAAFVSAMKKAMAQQANNPQAQQEQNSMKQLAVAKLTAEINKDQSIAEMNNAKAGATSSTATYDLAMAQNLLAKNDQSGWTAHLDAISAAAKAQKDQASAATEREKAVQTAVQTKTDLQAHHSSMQDANVQRHVDVHTALTNRIKAHTDRMQMQMGAAQDAQDGADDRLDTARTAAIDHISALAGAHADLASANRDRVGAVVDARPEPPAPAGQ